MMNSRSSFRIALHARNRWVTQTRLAVEQLEDRILPSINIVETEPNDTVAQANFITHLLDTPVHVSGKVAALGDNDWFAIPLDRGDVIGATLKGQNGLNPALRMVNSFGDLMIASDDALNFSAGNLPRESPLAHEQLALNDSEIYYVMSAPGTYYLAVSSSGESSTGKYQLDLLVARPGLEARPAGTQQILYLDFDGARVNFNRFANTRLNGLGQRTLSPLSDFLIGWGLTAADEHAVIDEVVAKVADKLSAYVRANGLNGDFAASGIPGQFGIEIRNSRDNPDEFGTNPLMSRVVVGGTEAEAGFVAINALAYAQDIDVGNFKTDDEAVVTLDFISGGLAIIPIQPPATTIDFVATGIASVVAHEAGHLFGCFHTDQVPTDPFVGTPGVMDPHPQTAIVGAIGPDLVFGTADDGVLQLSVEAYFDGEPFRGLNDTLNTVAFGLSTGKGNAVALVTSGGNQSTISNSHVIADLGSISFGAGGSWRQAPVRVEPANSSDAFPLHVTSRDLLIAASSAQDWQAGHHGFDADTSEKSGGIESDVLSGGDLLWILHPLSRRDGIRR